MEYYRILNLVREPFSNSPEPDFFYESRHHLDCLQKLEVALRLRRGLNVVIGQVGAGKTTLSRQLIRKLSGDPEVKTYLLLDPHFSTEMEFLTFVTELFGIETEAGEKPSAWKLREGIKQFLFQKAVEEKKLIVLIIDEGQKIPDFALESLREFLNYETNEFKLLQIAIFAQEEIRENLARNQGFSDRINLLYSLGPLNFDDTRAMVLFRVQQSTERGRELPVHFTGPAMRCIYRATGGYPRKIVRLCHQVLLTLIIKGRNRADWLLVRSVIRRTEGIDQRSPVQWKKGFAAAGIVLALVVLFFGFQDSILSFTDRVLTSEPAKTAVVAKASPVATPSPEAVPEPAVAAVEEEPVVDEYSPEVAQEPLPEQEIMVATAAVEAEAPDVRREDGHDAAVLKKEPPLKVEETALVAQDVVRTGEVTPPAVLGQIRIARNQFLCRAMKEVYGYCNEDILKRLTDINPKIQDPDYVIAGDLISIPAIPATRPQAYHDRYWVRIADGDSLGDINRRYRAYQWRDMPLRMVSYWNEDEGFRFSIIVQEAFMDEAAARRVISRLPRDVAAEAEVFAGWSPDTRFFGDL